MQSALPQNTGEPCLYREDAHPGPSLVHFYANEESQNVQFDWFWLVRILSHDWLLQSHSDWLVKIKIKI